MQFVIACCKRSDSSLSQAFRQRAVRSKESDEKQRATGERGAYRRYPSHLPRFYFFALLFTSHRPPLSEGLEQAKFVKTKRYCKSQVPGSISQTAVLNLFSGLVNLSAGRAIYEMNGAPSFQRSLSNIVQYYFFGCCSHFEIPVQYESQRTPLAPRPSNFCYTNSVNK